MMLPSIFTFLFLFLLPCLILSSTTEDQRKIAPESLQFIQRVPCWEPQGRCSFKDFAELRGEEKLLEEWMGLLYFDFDRYSSHDLIADILPGNLHVKLFRHKILVGRVLCGKDSMHIAANAKLCKDMDPSVLYAFQNGRKTNYWWTVSDFMHYRAFVLGNLLTLQYSDYMGTVKSDSFDEETKRNWQADPDSRKFMLVVQLLNAGLEVNTTDRVRAFDLVGVIVQTIPNVRVVIVSGVISEGVEFWWYDNRWCPELNDPNCLNHRITLSDLAEKDSDTFLCEIEKFSSGLDTIKSEIDLRPTSAASRWEESNHRLLMACPFIFLNAEGEKLEDVKSVVVANRENLEKGLTVIGNRETLLNTLISHGADFELVNSKILLKFHSGDIIQNNTDIFSRMTTAAGLQVEFKTYNKSTNAEDLVRKFNDVLLTVHYEEDYETLGEGYSPYRHTDELSLIISSAKKLSSRNLAVLNETEFQRRIASGQPPATVLFYVPWSSASLIALDLIFPSASNELASRFNRTARLYAVDCFNWNELCQKQGIDHYPTVKFFVRGSSRRLETVVSLAEILRETVMLDMEPLLEAKTPEDVARALNMSAQLMDHAVLGVGLKDAQVLEEFRKTAAAFKGKALFILLQHRDLPQNLQARIPDGSVASYSGRLRPDLFIKDRPLHADLAQFLAEARFGRVMELTWILFQEIQSTKRPILVLFVMEMTPRFQCLLHNVADRHRGQFHVTWVYMSQNTPFPILKEVKEPTIVLFRAGSMHRWTVKSYAEDETGCPRIGQELDLWLESIKEGKKPPDEFVKERKYPPEGLHINCVNDVYPHPERKEPDIESSEKQMTPTPIEMTEEDIGYSKIETASLPKSTTVNSIREEL